MRCLLVHSSSVFLFGSILKNLIFTVTFLPFREKTVGGTNLPSTVTLTEKEAIMRKVKLIILVGL